jgi:predicted transglutaminase-like cysteine proteinase
MRGNLALKRGLRLSLLVAGITSYLLGDRQAMGLSTDLSASQNVALRFPDLSASQNIALRFPDLSASQNVARRFPDLSASQNVALRLPELSASQNVAPRFPEAPAVGVPVVSNSTGPAALASPATLVPLIDFHATAALPPIGHSRFCLRYPDDCKVYGIDFRRRNIVLTPERWNELNIVNRDVNRGILAEVTSGNGATEKWVISPPAGDCKDYAVTKRHKLLARGWPSRALLLSEVVVPSGEHHVILVVRVKDADLVLDNLNDDIRLVATTYDQYLWVRIQSPQNPKFWTRARRPDAVHTADAAKLAR